MASSTQPPRRRRQSKLQRQLQSLKQELRFEPKLIARGVSTWEPPSIMPTLRSTIWIRATSEKPATGTWLITSDTIFKATGFQQTNLNQSIHIKRIRVFITETTGTPILSIAVNNSPHSNPGFSIFQDRGVEGASMAHVTVDLPIVWREISIAQGSSRQLFRILAAFDGITALTSITFDALIDVTLCGSVSTLLEPSLLGDFSAIAIH